MTNWDGTSPLRPEHEVAQQIEDLEGEIMLGAFHGYRMPAMEKRLIELYALQKEPGNE